MIASRSVRLVIIESPYAGCVEDNLVYARRCIKDSLMRGEAPFASHLLYPQPGVLDDHDPEERLLGMKAGFAWLKKADASAVYTDLGISKGMEYGISAAYEAGIPIEFREIGRDDT